MRLRIYWWLGLKRRVWPPMATRPVSLLRRTHGLGVGQHVGQRDLDLHVLAGVQAGHAPAAACIWRRRAEDHRVDVRQRQRLVELGASRGRCRTWRRSRWVLSRSRLDQRHDLDAVDRLQRVEVLLAEGAGAGQAMRIVAMVAPSSVFSRIEVAHGGVGRGHVIEAVRVARARSPSRSPRRGRSATSRVRCLRARPRGRSPGGASRPGRCGSAIRRSIQAVSHSRLIRPARGPCS